MESAGDNRWVAVGGDVWQDEGAKLTLDLSPEDVEFLDAYSSAHGLRSLPAALHAAVRALRSAGLGESYKKAWNEWSDSGEGAAWATTTCDGLATD